MSDITTPWMCQLCNKTPATTKEHLPPQCTLNTGKVAIEHIDSAESGMLHKTVYSNNGYWIPALCGKCNRKTGSWYGDSYLRFVRQISQAQGIQNEKRAVYVRFRDIRPARIIRQMYSMFICAQPRRPNERTEELRQYVLDKHAPLPSDAPQIYIYKNISRIGRITPVCAVGGLGHLKDGFYLSEIAWPPVGIIFSLVKHPRLEFMENITEWGDLHFKDRRNFELWLPQLYVNTPHPLAYGTNAEIQRWRDDSHIVWMIAKADDETLPHSVSATWQKI